MPRIKLQKKNKTEAPEKPPEGMFDDLTVDKYNLDKEASRQSELVRKYGLILSKAKDLTRRLKTKLEIVEYEQSKYIRDNASLFGIKKDTDTVVFKAVKTTPEWKSAFDAYSSARRKEEDYQMFLDSIKDRGYQIRILADLWLNEYYSQEESFERKRTKRKANLDLGD